MQQRHTGSTGRKSELRTYTASAPINRRQALYAEGIQTPCKGVDNSMETGGKIPGLSML